MISRIVFFLAITGTIAVAYAQRAADTALFEISLNSDSTSLLCCKWGGEIRRTLSGPVIMADGVLLFFSENGYVAYTQKGELVDSHSVFAENASAARGVAGKLRLAQPIDPTTLIYYREPAPGQAAGEILIKKLLRKKLKPLKEEDAAAFAPVAESPVFNIVHNNITDEMAKKGYLLPYLIGYSDDKKQQRWWTLDKFYAFASPLIHEQDGEFKSFFPGIKARMDAPPEVKRSLVEAHTMFLRNGIRYYTGTFATMGVNEEKYFQIIYVCDEAGNILVCDTLLKQENTDVVLGEDVQEKMIYTTKQTARYVFQPAISPNGSVFYGIIDYEAKKITVRKRMYYAYFAKASTPNLAHLVDFERSVEYVPLEIGCNPSGQVSSAIPDVTFLDAKGKRRKAIPRDLTNSDYLVRILRENYRDVERKLSRRRLPVPAAVDAIRDTLLHSNTLGCPYAISLSGPKGIHRSLDYPYGQRVLCARVLAVDTRRVIVRVDTGDYAEIIIFSPQGDFINRFIFNRQPYQKRRDIIVAHESAPVLEIDYESSAKGANLEWVPERVDN